MSSIFQIIYKNRPAPSTSSSTADNRTERSEQSGSQNIPKRRKSSTSDETQLKRKKKGDSGNYSLCLHHTM